MEVFWEAVNLLENVWFSEWILLVIGERNSSSLSRKGNVFAYETKYGLGGYMWWVLVVTHSRGSNNTTGALCLSSRQRCVFYMSASPLGTFSLHDVKDVYWPLGTPNLLQKEAKAALSPRVPTAHPKKDSYGPCWNHAFIFAWEMEFMGWPGCIMFLQWWGGVGVGVNNLPGPHGVEGRLFSKREVIGWTSYGTHHRGLLP